MRYYCTYFDHHYLPRGLALYDSLRRHGKAFELWVLCFSEECERILQQLQLVGVKTISLREFESGDVPLEAAKKNRSQIEYFFTCTPSLPLFLFKKVPEMDSVTYLDGDLYFFGNPEDVHKEIGEASIAITPHRFPPALRGSERYGIYNVGWITFRRDANALACLEWWRERCLEWCYDREENGKFADQKYLDCWPEKFAGVKVIEHPGVNLAPWNLSGHKLALKQGHVQVDGHPLLVFHFHGLKQLTRHNFDPQWTRYLVKPDAVLKNRIYWPYLENLAAIAKKLNIKPSFAGINPRVNEAAPKSSKQTRTIADILHQCRQFKEYVRNDTYIRLKNFPRKPYSIGVLLPTLNCARALENHLSAMERWIDLVQEIVVVDSHSEDGTLELIKKRIRHPGLRIFSRPRGLYQSWNFGISQIKSKYTYVSTVGDVITPEGIEHLVETAEHLNCDVIVSPPRFVGDNGKDYSSISWPVHRLVKTMQITKPQIFRKSSVFVMATDFALNHGVQGILGSSASNLYRTTVLQRFPFPSDYGTSGDVVWCVDHALDIVFAITPETFSEFLFHEKQYTPNTSEINSKTWNDISKRANVIFGQELQKGNKDFYLLNKWRETSKKYARAQIDLDAYRKRKWPWYLQPDAWRARSQKKRSRKQMDLLLQQITASLYFGESEMTHAIMTWR